MKRKGEAPNVETLSEDERDTLLKALIEKDPTRFVNLMVGARRTSNEARARENQPRKVERKKKGRDPSIGVRVGADPAPQQAGGMTKPDDALAQFARSFASAWTEDASNPAVELVSAESHLCARINTFHERRWTQRRVGDDAVVVVVKLQDGKSETRKFVRGVLDADWKCS